MAPGVMETTVTVGGQAGGRGLLLRKFAIRYPLGSGWLMLGWRGVGIEGGRGGATRPPTDRSPVSGTRLPWAALGIDACVGGSQELKEISTGEDGCSRPDSGVRSKR